MIGKLEGFLSKGRGIRNAVLEYKESVNSLSGSVFETVSSFSNREGLQSMKYAIVYLTT